MLEGHGIPPVIEDNEVSRSRNQVNEGEALEVRGSEDKCVSHVPGLEGYGGVDYGRYRYVRLLVC